MADERLTDDEVAKVLRRASELDGSTAAPAGDGLPVAAVEAAAAEVGVSPAAVRLAVAELRTGALDERDDPIVCARVLPGGCEDCVDAVGRWLKRQAFVRARDRGAEQVWRPREDWVAGLQRKLDWAAAIRLRGVNEIVVRAVEVEGGTLVRITAGLEPAVALAPAIGTGVGAVVGTAAGISAGLPIDLGYVVDAGLALVGAAGVGVGGWRLGRGVLVGRRARIADAIDGLLDELEHGRHPGGSPAERLAERARRLRGGYRL